jgi:glycosyltransferase involved in cell wall biosynthesis
MNVAIIRTEPFPFGNASIFRTMQLSKLISSCGNEVTVIASKINIDDYTKDWWSQAYPSLTYLAYENESLEKCLDKILSERRPDVVIGQSSIRHYSEIHEAAKKHGIPFVLDSVEWHNASNWRLGHLDPRYYQFLYMWRYCFPKVDGIIAISRMIETYYRKYMTNVVRIPTITDTIETAPRYKISDDKIRFIFSGQLDNTKDNIRYFVEAMERVDPHGSRFQLDVYGPSEIEVRKHMGDSYSIIERHDNVKLHGRVAQEEAQKACRDSDFSVFFRLNRRSANAGFPTKLGECMTFGTPAICNDTGDISLVLENRINGYLVKEYSADAIEVVLREIVSSTIEERQKMRTNARKAAELFFDFRLYADQINSVLRNACNAKGANYGSF